MSLKTEMAKPLTCLICNVRVKNRRALHEHFLAAHPISK